MSHYAIDRLNQPFCMAAGVLEFLDLVLSRLSSLPGLGSLVLISGRSGHTLASSSTFVREENTAVRSGATTGTPSAEDVSLQTSKIRRTELDMMGWMKAGHEAVRQCLGVKPLWRFSWVCLQYDYLKAIFDGVWSVGEERPTSLVSHRPYSSIARHSSS
jgi:hypothetical protein